MSDGPDGIAGARIDVERARARLAATVGELHARLKPDVLLRERVDRLRERSGELADEVMGAARARPALIGGVGAGMLLLWLRRPIARLGLWLFFRKDETDPPAGRLENANRN